MRPHGHRLHDVDNAILTMSRQSESLKNIINGVRDLLDASSMEAAARLLILSDGLLISTMIFSFSNKLGSSTLHCPSSGIS